MGHGRLAPPLLVLALAVLPAAAAAQTAVVSPGPEAVSISIYRNATRSGGGFNLQWLEGYALITETRTVDLPAGDSVVRFEGVAGGILPASAIAVGLPGGVGEKNRDARLLSPGTLVDAALGRRVHLRRTNRRTGKVTEMDAVIRSGPEGVVLETERGFEALRCTGLPETLVYDQVPAGLSDKPTLAVTTHSARAERATVRLSYLASGFDWSASYVASLAPDGRTLDLFAWLTLANSNDESFSGARASAIAGAVNKEEEDRNADPQPVASGISLECWGQNTTSDLPYAAPPAPGAIGSYPIPGEEIVVTARRIAQSNLESSSPITVISAQQEELGDLKLYRIPIPVTVAAHAQKQVALLSRTGVPFERLYGTAIDAGEAPDEPRSLPVLLRTKNVKGRKLGLPLPKGRIALFETVGDLPMLVGEGGMRDYAVGEQVELEVAASADVRYSMKELDPAKPGQPRDENRPRRFEVEITNARPADAPVELVLYSNDSKLVKPSHRLGRKDGNPMWRVRVPANGRVSLRYTIEPQPPRPEPEDD